MQSYISRECQSCRVVTIIALSIVLDPQPQPLGKTNSNHATCPIETLAENFG